MAIVQISKIQVRTGSREDLPVLSPGEFGYATDTKQLYIGNENATAPTDNTEIVTFLSTGEFSLPVAGVGEDGILGVIKVGENLSISETGLLSAVPSNEYVLYTDQVDGSETDVIITLSEETNGGQQNLIFSGKQGIKLDRVGLLNIDFINTGVLKIIAGSGIELLSATNDGTGEVTISTVGSVTSVNASGGTTGFLFTGGPITDSGVLTLEGVLNITNGGTGATNAKDAMANLLPSQAGNENKVLSTDGLNNLSWTTISTYVLPTASTTVLGGVKVDGTSITINNGVISGASTYTLPTASTTVLGGVKVDGTSITIDSNGVISGASTYTLPTASTTVLGGVKVDGTSITINNGVIGISSTVGTVTSVGISGGTTGLTATGGPITSSGTITLGGTLAIANGGTGATTANGAMVNLLPSQTGNENKVLSTNGSGTLSWINTATVGGSNTQIQYNNNGTLSGSDAMTFNNGTNVVNFTQHPRINGVQVGFRNVPKTTTLNTESVGKRVVLSGGIAIAGNVFAEGDAISIYNSTAGNITIGQGSGLTLRKDGTTYTGDITLKSYGSCFIWFNTPTEAIVAGSIA